MQYAQITVARSYGYSTMVRRIGVGIHRPAFVIGLAPMHPVKTVYLSQPRFINTVSDKTHNNVNANEHTGRLPRASRMSEALTWISPKLKEYGCAGVVLYSLIHSLGFFLTVVVLLCFWDDVLLVFRRFLPEGYSESTAQCTSQIFIASLLINKLFGPLHMLCAVLLAPRYVPQINKAMGRITRFFRA